ncbi:MAG: uncharacterized protein JWQ43_2419 [Glaciihabitans sp.]|nr:uncharacterized protein [Glaciihabitans sp.]
MSDTPPPKDPYATATPLNPSDEKMWATLVHVAGIFVPVLPALLGYLLLKDRGPFVRQHTTAALNFQLTSLIGYAIGSITTIALIGLFILPAVYIIVIVFSILAAVAANNGQTYKYPLTIEFIK